MVRSRVLLGLVLLVTPVLAEVGPEEAVRLEGDLTPLGAIRAGNDAGTIPHWDGGLVKPPAGYRPGQHHVDPFAEDGVRFTITAAALDAYAEQLSPGQVAMFERYPDTWRMPVYQTRRSASYPERIYRAAIANASTARLVDGGNGVVEAAGGYPFPIPQSGLEALWNHLLRFRGTSLHRVTSQVVPTAGGAYSEVILEERALWPLFEPGATIAGIENQFAYLLQEVKAPAQLAGRIVLVHETLNQKTEPREAWVYHTGERRVRRAPTLAYDHPGTAADGQRTADQLDMFNGAPDRYIWRLIGRRELYVPYNDYRLHDGSVRHDQLIRPGHLNPELLRYELHRVWEVDARLKDGASHIYARRTFFLDEDSWQILIADHYDGEGRLWRLAEAHTINYYQVPMVWETVLAIYDLENGRYLAFGLNNELPADRFDEPMSKADFTPNVLRRLGRR